MIIPTFPKFYYPYFSLFSKSLKTRVMSRGGCGTRTWDSDGPRGSCAMWSVALWVTWDDGDGWKSGDSRAVNTLALRELNNS